MMASVGTIFVPTYITIIPLPPKSLNSIRSGMSGCGRVLAASFPIAINRTAATGTRFRNGS
jgi:hypothetical protein